MKSIRDRYLTDATFHHVVDSMRALISGAQLTPSEVREAAILACIIEEERRPAAPITEAEMERMRQAVNCDCGAAMIGGASSESHSIRCMMQRDVIDFAAKQQGDTTRQMLREKGYDV